MESNTPKPFNLSGTIPPTITKKFDITLISCNIVEILSNQTKASSEKTIMKLVRGRKQLKVAALRNLVREGIVVRSGSGKKGDPYLYTIKLIQPTVSTASVIEEILI